MPDSFDIKERQFEDDIEKLMIAHGWQKTDSKAFNEGFDRQLALHKDTFLDFIKTSQPKEWKQYQAKNPTNPETSLIKRFDKVVRDQGLLKVIREGFVDRGIKFHVMFRKPETSKNADNIRLYESNIFQVVRQLHYSPRNENSIDIVLFVNGIPIITEELKSQFNGQDTDNAITQYKFDRAGKERIFTFKERVLAHFAVDMDNVYMTTRLQGPNTFFLPFNQGSNGAGDVGGKGNPVNPNGYATSYLWEEVLTPERLTEILFKYLHLQKDTDESGKVVSEKMIFPRYHQLDVVTKLLADAKANGAGKNYLIEHSAGSGKSNSIAWLAHRLSGLHDYNDEKIFQSVIIVTDRKVLDNQLQNTVYQFDHQPGLVQKIDKDSKQLKEALESGAGIIITTLQKFPVIYKDVKSLNKRFAVIVDEAHSSQTGNAAKKLKYALTDTDAVLEKMAKEAEIEEANTPDDEDRLLNELAAQGQQENLSFFAFTATPKDKTLQMFGTKAEDGSYHPFHIYSMRQAIEEGFILDVLQNYMTYKMYFNIAKNIEDNPDMDKSAGTRAVTNFETLHPHNIAQKVAIMLDHFEQITRRKIGGRAKAMVVTASRLHAVRYVQEFRRQIKERKMEDVAQVLVAFSGEIDDSGTSYTEEGMNKDKNGNTIKETALPKEFRSDDFNMLIVAEKYQTGFDEPLLHTMFVDKKLSGVKAVQTLSRLNRIARGKSDTFVLDFVNSAEDIQRAFQPYYEEAWLESAADPNLAEDLRQELMEFQVINQEDYKRFADIYFEKGGDDEETLGKLSAILKPVVTRFTKLTKKEQRERFKTLLARFNRFYDFITQVYRDFNEDLHKFSVFAKYLYKFLPKGTSIKETVDDKILLRYYRLEKESEGSIDLEKGASEPFSPPTGGTNTKEKERTSLNAIIEKVNDKYGTEFSNMDLVLMQIQDDILKDNKWDEVAATNSLETFSKIFSKTLEEGILSRYQMNTEFFNKLFSDPAMFADVREDMTRILYNSFKSREQRKHLSH